MISISTIKTKDEFTGKSMQKAKVSSFSFIFSQLKQQSPYLNINLMTLDFRLKLCWERMRNLINQKLKESHWRRGILNLRLLSNTKLYYIILPLIILTVLNLSLIDHIQQREDEWNSNIPWDYFLWISGSLYNYILLSTIFLLNSILNLFIISGWKC